MKIRFTDHALADLALAFSYIAKDSPDAAARVVRRIERTLEVIAVFPYSGRAGNVSGTRQSAVPRTPYLIVYRIDRDIEVLAVLHGRRNR